MSKNVYSNKDHYYKVDLEIARHSDEYVFGFVNISHIPYKKLYTLFKDQITDERFLFDNEPSAYFITPELYKKHKKFLDREVPIKFDFDLFQYSVGLVSVEIARYKKDYYEELPPFFKKRTNGSISQESF